MRLLECGAPVVLSPVGEGVRTTLPGDTPGVRPLPRLRSNGAIVMDTAIKKPAVPPLPADLRAEAEMVVPRPSRSEAEHAVRTLLAYVGDNPDREGLIDTPRRVVSAYEELYSGYREDPAEVLDRTFAEMGTYDDLVLVRNIPFHSHCEHHMMPFYGRAHVAYMPIERVVGLSKLARLIEVYARRLQTHEHPTSQLGPATDEDPAPRG